MRIAGANRAIGNLVKWAAKDDWVFYREEVFASHLDFIEEQFDVTGEELVDPLGDAFDILYVVILEDFFTARLGDDGELNVIVGTWRSARPEIDGLSESDVHEALERPDPVWDELVAALLPIWQISPS